MVSHLQPATQAEITYPDRDGNLMSDNTKQFRWIVTIQQNLESWFADDSDVFVAGDLLWYPLQAYFPASRLPMKSATLAPSFKRTLL